MLLICHLYLAVEKAKSEMNSIVFSFFFFFFSDMWKCNSVTVLLGVRILPSFPLHVMASSVSNAYEVSKALELQQPYLFFFNQGNKDKDEISLKC